MMQEEKTCRKYGSVTWGDEWRKAFITARNTGRSVIFWLLVREQLDVMRWLERHSRNRIKMRFGIYGTPDFCILRQKYLV